MPKISPRVEVTSHPLYQATMAAQHIAYQLMREVPADRKAEAARLHAALVHATTWASYALDPDAKDRAGSYRGLLESARDARARIEPIAGFAEQASDMDILIERLAEIEKASLDALGEPAQASA